MSELAHVKGVFTSPITLSGTGQASDGQSVAAAGEEWLVTANGVDNGVWVTSLTGWTRRTDLDASGDFTWGQWLAVQGGNTYYGSTWYYNGIDNPTLGADTLYFNQRERGYVLQGGQGIDFDPPFINVAQEAEEGQEHFLSGLKLVWVSATSLTIKAGSAWVPGAGAGGMGAIVTLEGDTTLSGLTLGAAGLYHIYLYESNQTGAIEIASQGPESVSYFDEARVKGPDGGVDETRRYIGSVYQSATNTIAKFSHRGNWIMYQSSQQVDTGLTGTAFSARTVVQVPSTCRLAYLRFFTNASSTAEIDLDTDGASGVALAIARASDLETAMINLTSTQTFRTRNGSAGGSTDIHCLGYQLLR